MEFNVNTKLVATVAPVDASVQDIVWTSSNPSVVSVNSSTGTITGLVMNGNAVITATVTDTKSGNVIFTDAINVHVTIA